MNFIFFIQFIIFVFSHDDDSSTSNSTNTSLPITANITNQQKMASLMLLAKFLEFESQLNITQQQIQSNTNFAKELWVNTEYTFEEVYEESPIELSEFVMSENFPYSVPKDPESIGATQAYLDQWQAQNDSDKSIILQTLIEDVILLKDNAEEGEEQQEEASEETSEEGGEEEDLTEYIKQRIDQNAILENNQKNKGTDKYIEPLKWLHTNVTEDEMLLASILLKMKQNNVTFEQYAEQQTPEQKQQIMKSLLKYFANSLPPENNTIHSQGTEPQILKKDDPQKKPTISAESPIYMYIVTFMMISLLIIIAMLFRRYMIRKKLLNFQMNEESNVQGFSA